MSETDWLLGIMTSDLDMRETETTILIKIVWKETLNKKKEKIKKEKLRDMNICRLKHIIC